jgi:hypothetical protein
MSMVSVDVIEMRSTAATFSSMDGRERESGSSEHAREFQALLNLFSKRGGFIRCLKYAT